MDRRAVHYRRKWISAAAIAVCCLVIGIPAYAGLHLNWDQLFGGKAVSRALEMGEGQQYNMQRTSEGVTMSLKGIVTDQDMMKILVSLEVPGMADFDAAVIEDTKLQEHGGNSSQIYGSLTKDKNNHVLLGMYTTENTLELKEKMYDLTASNLIFYQYTKIPVHWGAEEGAKIALNVPEYQDIRVESVTRSGEQTAIRYSIGTRVPVNEAANLDPHVELTEHGTKLSTLHRSVLKPEKGRLVMEDVYQAEPETLRTASAQLTYLKEQKKYEGTWAFTYKADGKKAGEALTRKKIAEGNSQDLTQKTGLYLKDLVISPLNITVSAEEKEGGAEQSNTPGVWEDVRYKSVALQMGSRTITGSQISSTNSRNEVTGQLFQFESPEWYRDWSGEPMKLELKEAVVNKRDITRNWTPLVSPGAKKQSTTIRTEDGYEIEYTYYMDGDDLMVESHSDTPGFIRISQTTLRLKGTKEQIYPEYHERGPNPIGDTVERYPNIASDKEWEINPGIYLFNDPQRDISLQLE
ncbi:DUF4179 domain-containing protein [Paenibacillus sp. JX-17]|uniref:DUF4179 domain-containing protein n=1 Tax=Paenibacillus lacisoli TaxID=3064525 RepID=A0ABT9CDB2_9BACL|nr:DUF4179 domain-containing protein [Paenibacillus sp. JX-17]MDO7906865.1 DUF4179 domain-containing protein [Paenibacillus sp. JX-17]